MITDNPLNDAINHINRLDKPDEVELVLCELCGCAKDKLDTVLDPYCKSRYCNECVISGEVTRYLERNGYALEEINEVIKLK